jgi:hypothetical protein
MQLFAFGGDYVVIAVHKFEFRLVIEDTPNEGDRCKEDHAVIETCFGQNLYVYPDCRRECKGTLPPLFRPPAFPIVLNFRNV